MADFFVNQLDFIFFFYGLSFFILAALAFSLSIEKKSNFAWSWLGIFGVLHGMNEWLDLFVITFNDNFSLQLIRTLFIGASFTALFEFARRTQKMNSGRTVSLWIYIPLFVVASLGALYGIAGLNITIRYFIGLAGGVFCAFVVYGASRKELRGNSRRNILFGLFILISCYAATTIFVVPKNNILIAPWINTELFATLLGLPVQIIRAFLAALLAIFLWLYYNSFDESKGRSDKVWHVNNLLSFAVPVLLIVISIAGWRFTDRVGEYARSRVIVDSTADIEILYLRLEADLKKVEEATSLMCQSPGIIVASSLWPPSDIERATLVLDRYKKAFNMSACYIFNNDGIVIASSNRNDPDSFIGQDYSFRPYFKDALKGLLGTYFALGMTSDTRGYYAASMIRDAGNNMIGVAAIKKNLDDSEKAFKNYPYAFLIDPNGIIFLSSKPELIFRSFWPVSENTVKALNSSRQFHKRYFESILSKEIKNYSYITFMGEEFFAQSRVINKEGWRIIVLSSTRPVSHYRFFAIIATLFLAVSIMVLFLIFSKERAIYEGKLKLAETLSEEKFIFSHTKDFVYRHDLKGVFNYVSPSVEQITGYRPDEWRVHYATYLTDSPENKKAITYTEEAMKTGLEHPAYEVEIYHKDGRRINLEVKEQPFFVQGRIAGIVGVARDISERKRSEKVLIEAERRFRDTLQNINLLAVQLDMNGNITFCNDFLLKLSGWEKRDVISHSWFDIFIPSANRKRVKDIFLRLVEEKKIEEYLHYENKIVTKSGDERLISWVNVVLQDTNGDIMGISSIGTDVTERRRMEDKLASLSRAVEQSPVSVIITNTDGDIEYVNPKFTHLTGYAPEEVIGKNPRMLKSGEMSPDEYKKLWETIKSGKEWRGEFHNKKKNSELYWESASISPIRDSSGKIIHFLAVKEDITERKKAEEELVRLASFPALTPNPVIEIDFSGNIIYMNPTAYRRFSGTAGTEALEIVLNAVTSRAGEIKSSGRKDVVIETEVHNVVYEQHTTYIAGSDTIRTHLLDITERRRIDRLKDDFIATVSHELRTPLSITKEGISLILDGIVGSISEEQAKVLTTSKDNIDRLARIINELLDISKIEAGKLILNKEKMDIVEVAKSVVESFTGMANTKKLELKFTSSEDSIALYADPDKITQIFVNLISNSIKFTDTGYVEVSVKENVGEIECSVRDTGIGIADEDLHKLFGKFQQFGRTAGAGEKGTGLGLSIAKRIVDMHNGEIWAESELGKGTKITFVLPKQIL